MAEDEDRYSATALAERMRQVVGQGPRVAPLAQDELVGEPRQLCIDVREAIGVTEHSNIPEYMRTMVKHTGIFGPHMQMGTAIFKGRIPARERELAVLRQAWLNRAPFEWGEHVDIGQRYGVTREEIERCTVGSSAPGWSEHDRAILRGVEELVSNATLSDETWEVLAKSWDEAQLLEFPMMVGQYAATAFVQNSIRARLADDNPGLTHR